MATWGNTSVSGDTGFYWSGINTGPYQVAQYFGNFPGGTVTDIYIYCAAHVGMGNTNMRFMIWDSAGDYFWASGVGSMAPGGGYAQGQAWQHITGLAITTLVAGSGYYIGFWREQDQSAEWTYDGNYQWSGNYLNQPGSLAGNGYFTHGGTLGAYIVYTPVPSGPSISGLSPSSGPWGTTVTINGSNFTGGGSISFGGTGISATSWSNTAITCIVPHMTGTQTITVSNSNGTSNGVNFTITGGVPIWNGSVWQKVPVAIWNGSAWQYVPSMVWNGSAWQKVG